MVPPGSGVGPLFRLVRSGPCPGTGALLLVPVLLLLLLLLAEAAVLLLLLTEAAVLLLLVQSCGCLRGLLLRVE